MCIAGISYSGSALGLVQEVVLGLYPTFGLVWQGISTTVGFLVVCNASIFISGGTNVAYANGDILEDSSNPCMTVDEPFACEVNQETIGA